MSYNSTILCFLSCLVIISAAYRPIYDLDERWICNIKRTCLDCLKLSQCSWCPSENFCFSEKLPLYEDFCKNNTLMSKDYGFSIEYNAECTCAGEDIENNCYPPGVTHGPVCSDRGTCVCGRCICDPNPDPEHPTKAVMGEYCEFDNFSCDGPKCNEGPYSLSEPRNVEDELEYVEEPEEE